MGHGGERAAIVARYDIEALAKKHTRKDVTCGVETLGRCFERQVTQDMRRNVATAFVALERESQAVHGYYTLSMAGVLQDSLPEDIAHKLPRYPTLPAVWLGRMRKTIGPLFS